MDVVILHDHVLLVNRHLLLDRRCRNLIVCLFFTDPDPTHISPASIVGSVRCVSAPAAGLRRRHAPNRPELAGRGATPRWRIPGRGASSGAGAYTHLRAHETRQDIGSRLRLEKKKKIVNESTDVSYNT